ncbi:MAG: glycosyltransferase family 9 protein [Cytophagales bacterium]|nr:glycosyltransferase family 9 protein [Cytophagales bacterium]
MKIIISRTDSIGDVILTLPMAGYILKHLPQAQIFFIARRYTLPVVLHSKHIHKAIAREDVLQNPDILRNIGAEYIIFVLPDMVLCRLAKKAHIPKIVGTSRRWYHWLYANIRVKLSRKLSQLHEAQLNIKLLEPFGIPTDIAIQDIYQYYGFVIPISTVHNPYINPQKINIIIHPKSKGSAREWSLPYYAQLITMLNHDKYHIIVTGTADEEEKIKTEMPDFFDTNITNAIGKISLEELIQLISQCDILIACSTGPLHIAAALGKHCIGLYPPITPMHPGRWAPVGANTKVLVTNKNCDLCRKTKQCSCMYEILPQEVYTSVENMVLGI